MKKIKARSLTGQLRHMAKRLEAKPTDPAVVQYTAQRMRAIANTLDGRMKDARLLLEDELDRSHRRLKPGGADPN